ncbi:hypothetical protein BUALT_Bualt14G0121800 [Buddleja alternifolia]|uniref:Uncharacterized protein n=1 Tax=Buddleja alternifolia TaxID=168488 RepID=A0AAV6WQY7_9LAMI|nr:hypothetical protein BUALT_Bualt14G0121800 [Buddleja alternifolia]
MTRMREMDEYRAAPYWSYTPDQRFEPIKTTTTTTAIQTYNPNPVYRVPYPPRNSNMIISSTASYTLSTARSGDSNLKRKQRIMSYKAYAVEGKVKASIRNTFRWVKNKYSSILHRY